MCDRGKLKRSPLPSGVRILDVKHPGGMTAAAEFRMRTSGWNGGGSRIPDANIWVEWQWQQNSGCEHLGGMWRRRMYWRQLDGIPTRVE
uniref:Uncharacterized protein n=1 Tax=Vitis vinifera TaxID=29760 RepID=A5CAT9_VITVI|nr:hypothetical protein VITISV_009796 [Vitis vinifera]